MSKKGKILIIDDNEELLIALKLYLSPYFKEIKTIKNPNLIHNALENDDFDIVLLDMNFSAGINSGNEGLFWMKKILDYDPSATILLITAYGDIELAVKAMKQGATDFIHKSWDEEKILSTIQAAFKLRQSKLKIDKLEQKQKHLTDEIDSGHYFCKGESDKMQEIVEMIDKVAKTDANILITGENGTGKEIIAREIHRRSKRADEIFVSVDVGAIPQTLFESELFGHIKGAFTDAKTEKTGRFEIASGGTLFLDEIGNIPLQLQSKLLTVLEQRQIIKVGSTKPVPIDIRLICATNQSVEKMVREGTFREDLYYRINTLHIEIPPLRKRKEDIPELANFFLAIYKKKYKRRDLRIDKSGMKALQSHNWSGNVRELRHTIEKAIIMSDGDILKKEDFSFRKTHSKTKVETESYNLKDNEKRLIKEALDNYEWNMSMTAKELGINRSTLYDKIKKYGL